MMNANGYGVLWSDNRKYITFTDLERQKQGEKQCKIRNNKLEKYYHVDFSKGGLEREFADNARKAEEHSQAVRTTSIAQYGRVIVADTATILEKSRAVLNQSTAISDELRLDRDDTRTTLRQSNTKIKSSTTSRKDRETERERLRIEESRRIAEQLEREIKEGMPQMWKTDGEHPLPKGVFINIKGTPSLAERLVVEISPSADGDQRRCLWTLQAF